MISEESGLEGLRTIIDRRPDVVLLDLGLPEVDGLEVLKMLRAVSAVPVIVVTARDAETEIVQALDLGADDYVIKPFSADQIDARVRAVMRRTAGEAIQPVEIGELRIDPRGREAWLGERRLELNRREFDLLCYLAQHRLPKLRQNVPLASTAKAAPVAAPSAAIDWTLTLILLGVQPVTA